MEESNSGFYYPTSPLYSVDSCYNSDHAGEGFERRTQYLSNNTDHTSTFFSNEKNESNSGGELDKESNKDSGEESRTDEGENENLNSSHNSSWVDKMVPPEMQNDNHNIDSDEYSKDDQESGTEEEEVYEMNQIYSNSDQGEIQDNDSVEDSREDQEIQSAGESDPNFINSEAEQQKDEHDDPDANTVSVQVQSEEEILDPDSETDQNTQGE